jgi:drug/metabolite transporter (DMT)-like permease
LTSTSAKAKLLGPAFALLGAIGFSAKAIFIKIAYATAHVDSVTLLALRMLSSLPFFLGMAWYAGRQQGAQPLTRRDWLLLAWFGFLGYYFSSYLDFKGLQYISAALERLILFTYPAVVVFLSAFLYKRPIHGREIGALLLSFSGIAIVFLQDLRISESPHELWIGGGLIFAASLTYACYLVGNTGLIRRIGAARFTGLAASISSVFVLGHFFATHPLAALDIPASLYMTVTALALLSTALPIWLTSEALRLVGPSRVAIISSVGPIVTIVLGTVFLGEHLSTVTVLGAVLVLCGVSLVTR